MRKVILWMQQTVDGHVAGPNGEFDWPVVLPEMNRFFNTKSGSRSRSSCLVDAGHHGVNTTVLRGRLPTR